MAGLHDLADRNALNETIVRGSRLVIIADRAAATTGRSITSNRASLGDSAQDSHV